MFQFFLGESNIALFCGGNPVSNQLPKKDRSQFRKSICIRAQDFPFSAYVQLAQRQMSLDRVKISLYYETANVEVFMPTMPS